MAADQYQTVCRAVRVKISVGACRFIASVFPCDDEDEAKSLIAQVKADFHDATHNTYAYRLGVQNILARSDDDREPAGTAGPPMLQSIESYDLTNTLVVGTRYFGGVKLGIGGLVRAYRRCAQEGLKAAGICKKTLMIPLEVIVPYEYLGAALRVISASDGRLTGQLYESEGVKVYCLVRAGEGERFKKHLLNQARGNVKIKDSKKGHNFK